jgi:antitoxin component of MazEF toxin-antitoxin module
MVNKVLKVGDSAAVTIPKHVLKDMGMAIGDKVTVTYHPETQEVVLKPVKITHPMISDRVARLTTQFVDHYRETLRRLA